MKDSIGVSIIMPAYNCENFIGESIESVQKQTYSSWELIIIDDCSKDNTKELVEEYIKNDDRISYTCLEKNGGPAVARNRGLDLARGKYIAFLDSDDLWMPEKLEKQIAFLSQHSDSPFCCSAYDRIDKDGKKLDTIVPPFNKADYWKVYFYSNPIGNSTVLYDRAFFKDARVPLIKKRNDFALWLTMLKNGGCCYSMKEPLATYRIREGSVSSNKASLLKYHWQLYREIEKHSIFVSLCGMASWAFVKGVVPIFKKK